MPPSVGILMTTAGDDQEQERGWGHDIMPTARRTDYRNVARERLCQDHSSEGSLKLTLATITETECATLIPISRT